MKGGQQERGFPQRPVRIVPPARKQQASAWERPTLRGRADLPRTKQARHPETSDRETPPEAGITTAHTDDLESPNPKHPPAITPEAKARIKPATWVSHRPNLKTSIQCRPPPPDRASDTGHHHTRHHRPKTQPATGNHSHRPFAPHSPERLEFSENLKVPYHLRLSYFIRIVNLGARSARAACAHCLRAAPRTSRDAFIHQGLNNLHRTHIVPYAVYTVQ